jgi:hypothetical protein
MKQKLKALIQWIKIFIQDEEKMYHLKKLFGLKVEEKKCEVKPEAKSKVKEEKENS